MFIKKIMFNSKTKPTIPESKPELKIPEQVRDQHLEALLYSTNVDRHCQQASQYYAHRVSHPTQMDYRDGCWRHPDFEYYINYHRDRPERVSYDGHTRQYLSKATNKWEDIR